MANLARFGQRLRELRTSRGKTQEELVGPKCAYKDARTLRKVEAGELRPRRPGIILILAAGLGEQNPEIFDELLTLAGYSGLTAAERSKFGLADQKLPATPALAASQQIRWIWRGLIVVGLAVAAPLGWHLSVADWLCCVLYASLFAVSVLLEVAHQFRGRESVEAALAAASISLPSALGALAFERWSIAAHRPDTLLFTILLFVIAAIVQWLAAIPGLPSYTIVRAKFQTQTGQAAHLKNSIYFLLLVFVFWIPPRHCIESIQFNRAFCPAPLWLWIIFVAMMAGTVPMGSRLLDNLESAPRQNLYTMLFWARAFLFFLLSAICLIQYSSAVSW